MSIHCPLVIQPLSEEAFEETDKAVMACAYASQNELGRLFDESVYENDVAARLRALGFTETHTQVPLTITHGTFFKTYRLDLVANQMVYEFKTVHAFAPEHDAQAIHYAVLLSIDRVKLVNFRSAKVMGRLQRTPLAAQSRKGLRVQSADWLPLSPRCERLADTMRRLFADWGPFLEARLFEEALIHFTGGEAACLKRIPVGRDTLPLGTHRVACHDENIAFIVTALTGSPQFFEGHLVRLLRCTNLRAFQWMNVSHCELTFVTVERPSY